MFKTFYISVQMVDYDDYPLGSDTKVGPFESEEEAKRFLNDSPKFVGQYPTKSGGYLYYAEVGGMGKSSVTIKNLEDTYMLSPERYNER